MENEDSSASDLIDARIAALGGWRGAALARMRALIAEAEPEVVETVKWRKPSNPLGVPVWERGGILCTGEVYKDKVKLTFAKGRHSTIPHGCSTPASTATRAARSTCSRAIRSTRRRSGRWCAGRGRQCGEETAGVIVDRWARP